MIETPYHPAFEKLLRLALRNREEFRITPETIEAGRRNREENEAELGEEKNRIVQLGRLRQGIGCLIVFAERGLLPAKTVEDFILKEVRGIGL